MVEALTVTRLVRRMKNLLEIEIGEMWVEGEISNLRRQSSGHCYFTLKDEGAVPDSFRRSVADYFESLSDSEATGIQ